MNWFETFFTISVTTLNLFSFMLGMTWALWNITTWGNPRKVWMQVLLYTVGVGLYYYLKSEGGWENLHSLIKTVESIRYQ